MRGPCSVTAARSCSSGAAVHLPLQTDPAAEQRAEEEATCDL